MISTHHTLCTPINSGKQLLHKRVCDCQFVKNNNICSLTIECDKEREDECNYFTIKPSSSFPNFTFNYASQKMSIDHDSNYFESKVKTELNSDKMVKEKLNQTRIYDDDGYRKRASCIVVKDTREQEVLLISSSRHTDKWIVPGGGVEPEESYDVAAEREVIEEAGVRGKIDRCLGLFQNDDRKHRTMVYVLVVEEELPEWEESKSIGRKRKWFKLEEALVHLSHRPPLLNYLKQLRPHKNSETGNSHRAPI